MYSDTLIDYIQSMLLERERVAMSTLVNEYEYESFSRERGERKRGEF